MIDLDCASCGLAFNAARPDGLVYEDDEFTCDDCGAVNVVGLESEEDDGEVYVRTWRCAHGVDGDEECSACRIAAVPSWAVIRARATSAGLHVSREVYGGELVACIEPLVRASTRYARIIAPRNEGQTDEERDALMRALVVAGIEAVGRPQLFGNPG